MKRKTSLNKWIRIYYTKMIESIAFLPAIIAMCFLIVSWVMIEIDFSSFGKEIKSGFSWLSLKDAGTARTIISTVAAAIISLTVFSFSMVMIVLNQAASQMSNRVLNSMIENRFQQIILGIYIGTIVYALFLLSTIRDISSGIYVPALSIYLLILITVIDIFLFIYFLDYVTQTVKYETVIDRVRNQTINSMKHVFEKINIQKPTWEALPYIAIKAQNSDYFQGFNHKRLLDICAENDLYISFLYRQGSFILQDIPCLFVYYKTDISKEIIEDIAESVDFYSGQPIERNADYGFHQLAEIALKALSPGINDPATANLSLHAIVAMLSYKMTHQLPELIKDENDAVRIWCPSSTFLDNFDKCIVPIWNYGKKDQYIQNELIVMIKQLQTLDNKKQFSALFENFIKEIEIQKINRQPS